MYLLNSVSGIVLGFGDPVSNKTSSWIVSIDFVRGAYGLMRKMGIENAKMQIVTFCCENCHSGEIGEALEVYKYIYLFSLVSG